MNISILHITFFILFLAQGFSLSYAASKEIPLNGDIVWKGTEVGLEPTISQSIRKLIKDEKCLDRKELISFLNDENRWVVAHYILSCRYAHPFSITAGQWNGLSISIDAKGNIDIPDQRETLYKFWIERSDVQK